MFEAELTGDDPGTPVLVVRGDFTMHERGVVEPLVDRAIAGDIDGLVLDLSGVTYLDSAGLMAVVSLYHKLIKRGRMLATVTGGNRYPRTKLIELGLDQLPRFTMYGSIAEARLALAGSARPDEEADHGHGP